MHPDIEIRPAQAVGVRNLTGLVAGTTLLTLDGELPVETLAAGDRVITRDCGMAILREVRVFTVTAEMIRIKAGTLGNTRPDRDMAVFAQTPIHIRDWRAQALYGQKTAMVSAERLIDGEFITRSEPQSVMMFELVFDRQHILYADGMEVGSATV